MAPIDEKTSLPNMSSPYARKANECTSKKKQLSSSWSIRGRRRPKVIWAEIMKEVIITRSGKSITALG